jgi:hypothetical protein
MRNNVDARLYALRCATSFLLRTADDSPAPDELLRIRERPTAVNGVRWPSIPVVALPRPHWPHNSEITAPGREPHG